MENEVYKKLAEMEERTEISKKLAKLDKLESIGTVEEFKALKEKSVEKGITGEWIFKNDGAYGKRRAYCSACGKRSGIGGIESNQKKPYCPNCGAKMTET